MEKINGKFTSALLTISSIEETCMEQIIKFINHPAFTNPIAIMPDTHAGTGSVIGFTMKLVPGKVIPNVIGVDIGCGMLSLNFGCDVFENMSHEDIDRLIRELVPFGFNIHQHPAINLAKDFPWQEVRELANNFAKKYFDEFGVTLTPPEYSIDWFNQKCNQIGATPEKVIRSIGTLGGGNHFIEFGKSSSTGDVWVTIHSGSRNFGLKIADFWQNQAEKDNEKKYAQKTEQIKSQYEGAERGVKIKEARAEFEAFKGFIKQDLAWLEGESFAGYLFDMIFAQYYAKVNRQVMGKIIAKIVGCQVVESIETVHNFIDFNDMIIRKGAIASYVRQKMIIPFNMRDGIIVCEGKSNPEWNYSGPHGAGRVLGRAQAKKNLSMKEFEKTMSGIFSTSVCNETLDEAPSAYKDANLIEEAIKPTANILDRLIPIHNMKSIS